MPSFTAKRNYWRQNGKKDLSAGLINAIVSIPDGLAAAALAGVNPVYGLYTSITAPLFGSPLLGTQLMQLGTTSASALAAGQVLRSYPESERDRVLCLLVVLTGLALTLFGFLRMGRLVRFVSHSVMTGFLTGMAAILVLDQLSPLVGFSPQRSNEILQFLDLAAAYHASKTRARSLRRSPSPYFPSYPPSAWSSSARASPSPLSSAYRA